MMPSSPPAPRSSRLPRSEHAWSCAQNSVVHINSELPPGRAVPEGWTAIGRPAEVVPPGEDERMLFSLYGVNFTKAVFGESRAEVGMTNYLELFGAHRDDRPSSGLIEDGCQAPPVPPSQGARTRARRREQPRARGRPRRNRTAFAAAAIAGALFGVGSAAGSISPDSARSSHYCSSASRCCS